MNSFDVVVVGTVPTGQEHERLLSGCLLFELKISGFLSNIF